MSLNFQPSTIQWFVDETGGHADMGNQFVIPLWGSTACILLETDGSMLSFDTSTGAITTYVLGSDVAGSGNYVANDGCALCWANDGYLYGSTNSNTILQIDPTTLTAPQESGSLGGGGKEGMAAVVGSDGQPYVVLGINNFTGPGAMEVFDPSTMALVADSGYGAPTGSNTYMTVGSGIGCAYGTATPSNSPSVTVYRGAIGAGGVPTYTTFATIAATTLDPTATWIDVLSPVVLDQTDNNLLLFVNTDTQTGTGFIIKLNATTGALMWSTLLPSGNGSFNQNSWNNSRITNNVCVFQKGANVCVVKTSTGAVTTVALGEGNGQLGGGQVSDSITGVNVCYCGYGESTSTLMTTPLNSTPTSFTYDWALLTAGPAFKGVGAPPGPPPGPPQYELSNAWTFVLDGHQFYVLNLGSIGTYVYDTSTGRWSNFQTVSFAPMWDMICGNMWGPKGDQIMGGDASLAVVYSMDPSAVLDGNFSDIYHEVTAFITTRGRSVVRLDDLRVVGSSGYLDEAAGATFTMQYSDDQGTTWSQQYNEPLIEAHTYMEIAWRSLGAFHAPGRIFSLSDVGGLIRIDGADWNTNAAPPQPAGTPPQQQGQS